MKFIVARWVLVVCLVTAGCLTSSAQGIVTYQLQIPNDVPWTDTGIDLEAGSQVVMTASGEVYAGASFFHYVGPDGVFERWGPSTVVESAYLESLIGKTGGTLDPFTGSPLPEGQLGAGAGFVGSSYDQVVVEGGRLFLGFNDYISPYFGFQNNSGFFDVNITVYSVPEPSVFAIGILAVGVLMWRRKCI